jgi:riboflavin kinase / FMN adenylyltransferase
MKVIYGIENINKKLRPSVVTVGVFDGIHTGHGKIISALIRIADKERLLPVVVTFDPHPDNVLGKTKKTPMLCSVSHRLKLLSALKVKVCVVLKFDLAFSAIPCSLFIEGMLVKKLGMKHLVAGERFSFGKERERSIDRVKEIAEKLDFDISVIKAKAYKKHVISSSIIRLHIEQGRLDTAAKLLGRPVSVLGTVVHGQKRGRIIGFKTANIDPHHEAIPKSGVYAAYTQLDDIAYKSVVNIGKRPTFFGKDPSIEVHIFGISKDIYGKDIEVFFIKRLRPERRFKNEDKLREQIKKDAVTAKKVLRK